MTQEELQKKFAAQLRMLRKRCGLSLEELEHRSGISASSLSAYERGAGNPSLQNLGSLASSLSVPIYVLIGEEPEVQRDLAVQRLKLNFVAEILRFGSSSGVPENLESCLTRCMTLLKEFEHPSSGGPDGSED